MEADAARYAEERKERLKMYEVERKERRYAQKARIICEDKEREEWRIREENDRKERHERDAQRTHDMFFLFGALSKKRSEYIFRITRNIRQPRFI